MRRIEYLQKKELTEAQLIKHISEAGFKAGKAKAMVPKIASLLAKRTRMKVGISTLPTSYSNSFGKFDGYFGFYGASSALRLNFLMGGNDRLYSIDFYSSAMDRDPTQTMSLEGYNIVEVLDLVVDYMTGEYEIYASGLAASVKKKGSNISERLTIESMMAQYLTDNPSIIQDIEGGRADYAAIGSDFIRYIQLEFGSNKSKMSAGGAMHYTKLALAQMGKSPAANSVPGIKVDDGVPDTSMIADPAIAAMFAEAVNPSPVQLMQDMEDVVREIGRGNKFYTGALIYGKAGSGKTETVQDVLRDEGAPFVDVSTPIGGYTGFLYLLYSYKDDQILVFDDNDSIFVDDAAVNLLKKALERKPVRTFSVLKDTKVRGTENFTPEGDFQFTSKIIFMSNKTKMDAAIVSRLTGAVFEINFTNDEMFQIIEAALENIYAEFTEITNVMRTECLEFIRMILPAIKDIDFRRFQAVLAVRQAFENAGGGAASIWQKRAIQILTTSPKLK